jgi:hypothetical protein
MQRSTVLFILNSNKDPVEDKHGPSIAAWGDENGRKKPAPKGRKAPLLLTREGWSQRGSVKGAILNEEKRV